MTNLNAIRHTVLLSVVLSGSQAVAQYVPNKLFVVPYTIENGGASTLSVTTNDPAINATISNPIAPGGFFPMNSIPSTIIVEESNMNATGNFSNNQHNLYFTKTGETGLNSQGHRFQRSEAWDIAFDLKIESNNPTPRKEAGFFFTSPNGEAMFVATTSKGHFIEGPGDVTTVFQRVIPTKNFSAGPLGDYSLNGAIDAADYTIWRDTLGSTEDFRANGTNEGASLNLIDQADYDVWKNSFGTGSPTVTYTAGETIRMRMIYTPPITDPLIPFNSANPSANVITGGRMEYQIALNGGPTISSGPLEFTYADAEPESVRWMGIPNGTTISLRVQNLTKNVVNDGSKVTFSNIDVNGSAPAMAVVTAVPEPATAVLAVLAASIGVFLRSRR